MDRDTLETTALGRARYPHVFEPLSIAGVEIRNRMYMPPHGIPMEAPLPGRGAYRVPAEDFAAYYAERARGGVGLLFHSTTIGPFGRQPINVQATPWWPEAVPSYRKVAEAVHEHGAKIMAQIWYAPFEPHMWEQLGPEAPTLGASATGDWVVARVAHQMSMADIRKYVAMNAQTARHLLDAGYDGIAVHASHGVLIEQFISPSFNKRTDDYGGAMQNRMRILREVLEAVRDATDGNIALGIRITADELLETGYSTDDARDMLRHLKATELLDFVDLDVSIEPEQAHLMTTSFMESKLHNTERVAAVREAVRPLPVLAAPGRVTSIAEAETLLERGVVDMVGAMRGHIAEPALVRHALEGREDESRTCIAANHCLEAGALAGFGCAINPEAGKELRWGSDTHRHARNTMAVMVIGAGPAGLEAARVACERGHTVRLIERRARLGGQIDLWSRLPGREHLGTLIGWYERRLAQLGLQPELGVEVDETQVLAANPDVLVVATGARYASNGESGFTRRDVPGWDRPFVHTPEAVIEREVELSGRVVIVDDEGLHAAAGVAEIAARTATDVYIITRKESPAAHVGVHRAYVMPRLAAAGVKIVPQTWVTEIGRHRVSLEDLTYRTERTIDQVDAVILATMRQPVDILSSLSVKVPYMYVIGDALAPRGLREATYEGYRFARVIGEPDMPKSVMDAFWNAAMPTMRPAEDA